MRTKLQITPSTDLERRLSAVQHRKLQLQLPRGLTLVYLVGSLLFTCLYFIEFLAFLPNVTTTAGMTIFMGLAIAAVWALNRYNREVAAHWKQQINDRLASELAARRLTHHDINVAELQQLLTRLNVRIIRTSDSVTSQGVIESAFAIARLENHDAKETHITDTDSQTDRADDPLVKFKPGWYVLYRFSEQQTIDHQLSVLTPAQTIDQLVDVIIRILLSEVKFKRVRSVKH